MTTWISKAQPDKPYRPAHFEPIWPQLSCLQRATQDIAEGQQDGQAFLSFSLKGKQQAASGKASQSPKSYRLYLSQTLGQPTLAIWQIHPYIRQPQLLEPETFFSWLYQETYHG